MGMLGGETPAKCGSNPRRQRTSVKQVITDNLFRRRIICPFRPVEHTYGIWNVPTWTRLLDELPRYTVYVPEAIVQEFVLVFQ